MDRLPYDELERLVAEAQQQVPPGSRWRHYKGPEYTIAGISIIEATDEIAVVYTPIDHPTVSFVRPLSVWAETVEWDGRVVARFTRVAP